MVAAERKPPFIVLLTWACSSIWPALMSIRSCSEVTFLVMILPCCVTRFQYQTSRSTASSSSIFVGAAAGLRALTSVLAGALAAGLGVLVGAGLAARRVGTVAFSSGAMKLR